MRPFLFAAIVLLVGCSEPATAPGNGLEVWAEATPSTLSIGDTSGSLRIRIYASNQSFEKLTLPGGPPYVFALDPSASSGLEQSFRIANDSSALNAGPGTDFWGQPSYPFAPFETIFAEQQVTLRQWVAGGWTLKPGPYKVRSWFDGHEGTPASFSLVR